MHFVRAASSDLVSARQEQWWRWVSWNPCLLVGRDAIVISVNSVNLCLILFYLLKSLYRNILRKTNIASVSFCFIMQLGGTVGELWTLEWTVVKGDCRVL